ncbi:MAG TPA: hypothetical protein VFX50_15520, partial [Gemmatimonadales bacterium]|nr:hypothetical protein [Gemmatimonadales bacterium]
MTTVLHAIAPGPAGGAETVVLALLGGLRARGERVALAVLADAGSGPFVARAREAGLDVTVLDASGR